MRTEVVSKTQYVCENCGASYSDKYDIYECPYSGKEICKKCGKGINIKDKSIYDISDRLDDMGDRFVKVHPDIVKATELELDLDREDYVKKLTKARKIYAKTVMKIDKMYLAGKIRDYNIFEGEVNE